MDEEDDSKIFPQKLMEILRDPTNHDSICWLPHGKGFLVHNRKLFAETVMPRYFSRKAKYSSFTRKLNRWNFTRVSSGPELGAYHHEFFLRDRPHLAAQMFCKNARTMLAMASKQTDQATEKPAQQEVSTGQGSVVTPAPNNHAQVSKMAPLWSDPQKSGIPDDSLKAESFGTPFGGASSLQVLERQMMALQQQEQANRMMMERALLMQHQQPMLQQQRERMFQMRQMMQLGMQQQRARQSQPSNHRASAA